MSRSGVGVAQGDRGLERTLAYAALAILVRLAIGGPSVASSIPAALGCAAVLAVAAGRAGAFAGFRRDVNAVALVTGVAGTVVLVGLAWLHGGGAHLLWVRPTAALTMWSLVIVAIATTEEIIFRGVLLEQAEARWGFVAAIAMTSVVFGLVHVPLYGLQALPLDIAAGVWLAAVRLCGGLPAAITTHVLADLTIGWLR